MIKSGAKPTKPDHRDFDLIPTFGIVAPPTFPESLNFDAGLWCPDQNAPEPVFKNPALPYGCTDYTQADLVADLEGKLHNPMDLENITHANARGGIDIRESLAAVKTLGWDGTYFTIRPSSTDFFDAVRLAMMFGTPEKRTVSVGIPWFPSFELTYNGILTAPDSFSTKGVGWHNFKVCGWETVNGIPYLIGKSWQGTNYANRGYHRIDRALFNQLMSIPGTCAFTITKLGGGNIQTVSLTLWQTLLSYIRTYLSFSY